MADKMMRLAGRGTDGTAKAIKTDNNGILEVFSESGRKNRLAISATILPGDSVSYEVALTTVLSSSESVLPFSKMELSWFSPDNLGEVNTEVVIYYHRQTANLTYNSVTFLKTLRINEGIKGESGAFWIDSEAAQNIKNDFITIKFVNNSAVNKGLYYPTLILKK